MGLNLSIVGQPRPALTYECRWQDCALYALGVGATPEAELDYLYEGGGLKVLPTFAVVPAYPALSDCVAALEADPRKLLHGEQTVRLHRPVPASGTFSTVATVTHVYDKGKGALAVVEAVTSDATGEKLFTNVSTLFVRGEGGFGGDRGPKGLDATPPERAPDFEEKTAIPPSQAALYRLSGDLNPLHILPAFAKAAGFDQPILHGLCTYGYAARIVLARGAEGDLARFRSFSARFAGVVFPGDTLVVRGWETEAGLVVTADTEDGRKVLSNSLAEIG